MKRLKISSFTDAYVNWGCESITVMQISTVTNNVVTVSCFLSQMFSSMKNYFLRYQSKIGRGQMLR